MNGLPRGDWRHAALSGLLLIAVIILLYTLLIAPAVDSRLAFAERFEELQFQYQRFENIAGKADQIRDELTALRETGTDTSGFLEEKPPALAAADLQKYIQDLIDRSGGSLISTQIMPGSDDEAFPAITVKVHMRADIRSLQRILATLESGSLYLVMDNLFLQSHNQPAVRGNTRRRGGSQTGGIIEARFDVTGYIFQAGGGKT